MECGNSLPLSRAAFGRFSKPRPAPKTPVNAESGDKSPQSKESGDGITALQISASSGTSAGPW
jgi:hypothetical protein